MNWNALHKLGLAFLIFLLPLFIVANFSVLRSKKDIASTFSTAFLDESPIEVDKSFVLILCVESKVSEKTLSSIFEQNYENFRIILIDSSNDLEVIQGIYHVAYRYSKEHIISILKAQDDSLYHAVHSCRDDEIVLQMEHDDWLLHNNVLERINQVYANDQVWLTYSQYVEYPSWRKGNVRPFMKKTLKKASILDFPWVNSPFKTYYAGVFKKADSVVSLIEMSEKHIRFIDDALYVHPKK
ncbi:MAG: glycosyltransferase [Chlamydiae bacterium]|nr:glycosyltransferase [Chlamydiota bacterium]